MAVGSAIPLSKISLKTRLIAGPLVSGAAMILFAFSFTRADYWPKIFVGFVIGSGQSRPSSSVPRSSTAVTDAVLFSLSLL